MDASGFRQWPRPQGTRLSPMNDPSFAYFRRTLYALVCTFGLVVTAQAQTALPAVQQAERAVLEAQQADADHYAPDLIEAARQGLIEAQALRSEERRVGKRSRCLTPCWN